MKKRFTFLKLMLSFGLLTAFSFSSVAQNTCCHGFTPGFASVVCISSVSGCAANVAPCNDAGMDAAHGANSYHTFSCNTEPNCNPGTCTGGLQTLPVELASFGVEIFEEGIQVVWTTASEENNKGFKIQKSRDGSTWRNITFIEGRGTTQEVTDYVFMDETPYIGLNYYRLKQIDYDGEFEHSNVAVAVWQGGLGKTKMATMPNPARDWMTVALPGSITENATPNEKVTYEIYSVTGQLMFTHINLILDEVRIDLTDLPAGNYVLKLRKDGVIHNAQFVKIQ